MKLFRHALSVHLQCLPAASTQALIDAFTPLLHERGFHSSEVKVQLGGFQFGREGDEDQFRIVTDHCGFPREISIECSGLADEQYVDAVQKLASNLTPLCKAGPIEFRNLDESPEKGLTELWVGEGHDLETAKRKRAIEASMTLLAKAGMTQGQVESVRQLVEEICEHGPSQTERPRVKA